MAVDAANHNSSYIRVVFYPFNIQRNAITSKCVHEIRACASVIRRFNVAYCICSFVFIHQSMHSTFLRYMTINDSSLFVTISIVVDVSQNYFCFLRSRKYVNCGLHLLLKTFFVLRLCLSFFISFSLSIVTSVASYLCIVHSRVCSFQFKYIKNSKTVTEVQQQQIIYLKNHRMG